MIVNIKPKKIISLACQKTYLDKILENPDVKLSGKFKKSITQNRPKTKIKWTTSCCGKFFKNFSSREKEIARSIRITSREFTCDQMV